VHPSNLAAGAENLEILRAAARAKERLHLGHQCILRPPDARGLAENGVALVAESRGAAQRVDLRGRLAPA